MTIKLGEVVRDTLTGYKGTVIAITDWLWGPRRITIQPHGLHEGKPIEPQTFDEPNILRTSRAAKRAGTRAGT